ILEDKARMQLKHDDEQRQKWALFLYGVDIADPVLYDLTVNVSALGVEDSAGLIAQTAELPCYQATEESRRNISDQALSAEIRAALFDFPLAGVSTREGRAYVTVKAPEEQADLIRARIESAVGGIVDLSMVEIRVDPFY
ncbi:MAG: cytidylate kinase family protein, partial [Desulfocapsaceae bacterium]